MARRIRKEAPDGATHYSFTDDCYYNVIDTASIVWRYEGKRWVPLSASAVRDTRHGWLDLREPPLLKTLAELGCYILALTLVLYFCKTFGWV